MCTAVLFRFYKENETNRIPSRRSSPHSRSPRHSAIPVLCTCHSCTEMHRRHMAHLRLKIKRKN